MGSRCFFPTLFYTSDSKRFTGVYCDDLGESFHMSIYYLLAKFGFDTAENEPCKVCQLSAYRSPRLISRIVKQRFLRRAEL